jgi:peptidoglycan/LPS O-acetylase OafA/YrhL
MGSTKIIEEFISKRSSNSIKGIAILLVLVFHMGDNSGLRYFNPFGPIGVSLFLILSAYGLNESYKRINLKTFFLKRIERVIIPYWIVLVVYALYIGIFSAGENLIDFISFAVMWKIPVGMYWYLQCLVLWYVSFFIVYKISAFLPVRIAGLLFVSLLFLMFGNQLMAQQAFSFPLGIILSCGKKHMNTWLMQRGKQVVAAIGSLFVALVFLTIKQSPQLRAQLDHLYIYLFIQIPILLGASLAILLLVTKLVPSRQIKLTEFFGAYSYEIYLTHVFLLNLYHMKYGFLITSATILALTVLLSILLKKAVAVVVCRHEMLREYVRL